MRGELAKMKSTLKKLVPGGQDTMNGSGGQTGAMLPAPIHGNGDANNTLVTTIEQRQIHTDQAVTHVIDEVTTLRDENARMMERQRALELEVERLRNNSKTKKNSSGSGVSNVDK